MEYYVKGKPTEEELKKIFSLVKRRKKGVNVRKYAGKLKIQDNPVTIQRRLRDEWD